MKNLISTLFLGGALVLGSCENKESVKEETKTEPVKVEQFSELEKYNQENKQVYSDFIDFVKENSKKPYITRKDILYSFKEKYYFYSDDSSNVILVHNKNKTFYDDNVDGINGRDHRQINNKIEFSENLSPEKQLEIAKDYTENLKQIMHDEKYKNY